MITIRNLHDDSIFDKIPPDIRKKHNCMIWKNVPIKKIMQLSRSNKKTCPKKKQSRGYYEVRTNPNDERDIQFIILERDDDAPIPEEMLEFKDMIEKALLSLQRVFPESEDYKFQKYFDPLLSLARVGLVGHDANVHVGERALESWKESLIANEGYKIKTNYWNSLGWRAAVFSIISLAFGVIAVNIPELSEDVKIIVALLFVWTGCMAGVWISFGIRRQELALEDLADLAKQRLKPSNRLVFAGMMSIFISLFFLTDIIVIEFGNITTSDLESLYYVQILLGMVLGLSEQTLSTKVVEKTSEIVKRI
jgi:hypothetical protein